MKLPHPLLSRAFKATKRRVQESIRRTISRREYLVPLYYKIASTAFDGEMKSVHAGQMHHLVGDKGDTVSNTYAFRRNIHRIEKGLSMRPRRPVFGTSYIQNTTAFFDSLVLRLDEGEPGVAELFEWSRDVLGRYFEVVESGIEPAVDAAREQFHGATSVATPKEAVDGVRKIPFADRADGKPSVAYEKFKTLALARKSVRWYKQRPLPRDIIDKAVEVARFAPSACNRQPFEFRVYDDPLMISKIGSLASGASGLYQNYPCLIVLVGRLRAFPKASDRHIIYIDASLAAMSMIFAFETMGIGSCVVNWPDVPDREKAIRTAMGLEPDERVVMMISAGYPDPAGDVCWSERKPVGELRRFNVFSFLE